MLNVLGAVSQWEHVMLAPHEARFFTSKALSVPNRCKHCRAARRAGKQFFEDIGLDDDELELAPLKPPRRGCSRETPGMKPRRSLRKKVRFPQRRREEQR